MTRDIIIGRCQHIWIFQDKVGLMCVWEKKKKEKKNEQDPLHFLRGKLKARQGTYCRMDVVSLLAVGRKGQSPAQATGLMILMLARLTQYKKNSQWKTEAHRKCFSFTASSPLHSKKPKNVHKRTQSPRTYWMIRNKSFSQAWRRTTTKSISIFLISRKKVFIRHFLKISEWIK